MNEFKLDQGEEVITFIEKQLKEQHIFFQERIDPVSLIFSATSKHRTKAIDFLKWACIIKINMLLIK